MRSLGMGLQKKGAALVSRLRLDARLFDFPAPRPPGTRGRKPQKGHRIASLKALSGATDQVWEKAAVRWYGDSLKTIEYLTGVCLWHTPGEPPVPIRWVLARDPEGVGKTEAFFSTDTRLSPWQIVEWFVLRWSVEVTFEETRRHLGVETQRQWSDLAIARTTPALMALFSIVCLIAFELKHGLRTEPRNSAWYIKPTATFSDILAAVRRFIWAEKYFNNSAKTDEVVKFKRAEWEPLLDLLAAVA